MSIEWSVQHADKTHTFSSDLPDTDPKCGMSCNEWVLTQTVEMQATWDAFVTTDEPTDATNIIYYAWLNECKVTHTVKTGDTLLYTNSYK
jgi:hypothetical protein